jgi:phage protein D
VRSVSSGDSAERKLSRVYASEDEAKRAGRAPRSLNLSLSFGGPDPAPEQPAIAEGFKADIDAQRWLISEVNHQLGDRGGYTTALKLELPH